jgi:ADP-ribose pyrophosphatase YjhB (NUDIX family)
MNSHIRGGYFIARFLLKPVDLLRKTYWKIFKPSTFGVRLLYIHNDKILLVKHSYSNQWYLPGGQVKVNESIEDALKREITEELGVAIPDKLPIFGIYFNAQEGKRDHIILFLLEEQGAGGDTIFPRSIEIRGVKDFPLDNLPDDASPGTKRRVKEFLEQNLKGSYLRGW